MRGGEAGQYSPGASSALTQIVPYSASLYTVFRSVFYNSVCKACKKLTNITEITEIRAKSLYGAWNRIFLPAEIKVLLFKFYNFILGTNLRVSKFNHEINPECTFCSIRLAALFLLLGKIFRTYSITVPQRKK